MNADNNSNNKIFYHLRDAKTYGAWEVGRIILTPTQEYNTFYKFYDEKIKNAQDKLSNLVNCVVNNDGLEVKDITGEVIKFSNLFVF